MTSEKIAKGLAAYLNDPETKEAHSRMFGVRSPSYLPTRINWPEVGDPDGFERLTAGLRELDNYAVDLAQRAFVVEEDVRLILRITNKDAYRQAKFRRWQFSVWSVLAAATLANAVALMLAW